MRAYRCNLRIFANQTLYQDGHSKSWTETRNQICTKKSNRVLKGGDSSDDGSDSDGDTDSDQDNEILNDFCDGKNNCRCSSCVRLKLARLKTARDIVDINIDYFKHYLFAYSLNLLFTYIMNKERIVGVK